MEPVNPRKYAKVERERRFLVATLPPEATEPREITDRYLVGTRLRLRRVSTGSITVLKLGHKVRPDAASGEVVLHTSMYLSPQEYDALAGLPASPLRKTRYRIDLPSGSMSIDVFHYRLEGLILAEVDLASDLADEARFEAPEWCGRDVTHDPRFSGGSLAADGLPA